MTRHSDPALFSEAEVTLVDHDAGHRWDLDENARVEPTLLDIDTGRARYNATDVSAADDDFGPHDTLDTPFDDADDIAARLPEPPSLSPPPMTLASGLRAHHRHTNRPTARVSGVAGMDTPQPTLTAGALRERRAWARGATDARRSLAERRDQREALARVIAMAKPRSGVSDAQPTHAPRRLRAATRH